MLTGTGASAVATIWVRGQDRLDLRHTAFINADHHQMLAPLQPSGKGMRLPRGDAQLGHNPDHGADSGPDDRTD